MENRINDPQRISGKPIDAILARGGRPTIQFSRPGYSKRLLKSVNELCREYGDRLEVRFYGHYSGSFDASILSHIPDVRWLSVDCLQHIENASSVCSLQNVTSLSFDVYYFDQPDFLSRLGLEQLTRLSLVDNQKRNMDLQYFERCAELDTLFLGGFTKNIDSIALAPKLREMSLGSIPKKQPLDFVNRMDQLRELTIVLGGRDSIDELHNSNVERLDVLRVRGLTTLGDLSRFSSLRTLSVEDQLKILDISFVGTSLEEIAIYNCKSLNRLDGVLELPNLKSFRVSRTKLDLDELMAAHWQDSVDVLALYSTSQKWNDLCRAKLDSEGYREFS